MACALYRYVSPYSTSYAYSTFMTLPTQPYAIFSIRHWWDDKNANILPTHHLTDRQLIICL